MMRPLRVIDRSNPLHHVQFSLSQGSVALLPIISFFTGVKITTREGKHERSFLFSFFVVARSVLQHLAHKWGISQLNLSPNISPG